MVPVCFGAMPRSAWLRSAFPLLIFPVLSSLIFTYPILTWVYRWYDMR